MNKYIFNKERKQDILKGRTITYVADNILGKQNGYITNILNGKVNCNIRLANWIATKLDPGSTLQDYFKEV